MWSSSGQAGTQSEYLKHVVVSDDSDVVVVVWLLADVVVTSVFVVRETVMLVSEAVMVFVEMEVEDTVVVVTVVVVLRVVLVSLTEVPVDTDVEVLVTVVQYPHISSHIPAMSPMQSGQKRTLQTCGEQ